METTRKTVKRVTCAIHYLGTQEKVISNFSVGYSAECVTAVCDECLIEYVSNLLLLKGEDKVIVVKTVHPK